MPSLGQTGEVDENHYSKQVLWKVPNFFNLSTQRGDSYESPFFCFADREWSLQIYPGGDSKESNGWMSLYLKMKLSPQCSIQYRLGLKDVDGCVANSFKEISYTFNRESYGYPKFFQRLELLRRRSELMPSNVLTVVCIMRQGDLLPLATPESTTEFRELENLSKSYQDLLVQKKSCDVTLVVQEKPFQAHKSVLIARSPVFAVMFEHQMSESETGTVDIPDCDEESFGTFLEYLYSGRTEDVSFDSALHLYRTAHKYDVRDLKSSCVRTLKKNLTLENFSEAAVLADQYDEPELMSSVQDFFSSSFGEIVPTKQWESLHKQNFSLANKLLITMSSYISTLKIPFTIQAAK